MYKLCIIFTIIIPSTLAVSWYIPPQYNSQGYSRRSQDTGNSWSSDHLNSAYEGSSFENGNEQSSFSYNSIAKHRSDLVDEPNDYFYTNQDQWDSPDTYQRKDYPSQVEYTQTLPVYSSATDELSEKSSVTINTLARLAAGIAVIGLTVTGGSILAANIYSYLNGGSVGLGK